MTTKKMPQLVSVMTPFPHAININEPAYRAEEMMQQHGFRHLPVLDDGNIESIISERDIARASSFGHSLKDEKSLLVSDICSPRVFIADVSDPLDKILDVMAEKHIGAVIVAKEGELAGIFTDSDACSLLSDLLREHFPDPYNDTDNDIA